MVRTNRGSFLRGFLERFLDNEYAHNRLTQPQYLKLQASLSSTLVNRLETCLLLRTPFIFCEYIGCSPRGVDTGGMPAISGVCCECSTTRIRTCASSSISGSLTFSTKRDFDRAGSMRRRRLPR